VARLIDFGVAKAVGNASATRDGQIKGKVAYMAPEQIRCEPVDRRADIYAASVVLWELVTGKRYFDEAGSDAAVVLRTLTKEAVAPSKVRPEVTPELDAVILKGISRDPAARYATAREMAQALEKVAPPAAARDVARWVDAKAGDALRFRAHQFSAFDHSIATELPGRSSLSKAPVEAESVKTPPTAVDAPAPAVDAPAPVEVATERAPGPAILDTASASPPPRSKTVFVAVPALLVAGVLGFLLARMVPSQAREPERASAAEPTVVKQPEAPPPAVASTPAPPPAASSAPQAAASEAPVASATAKPRAASHTAPHSGARPPATSGGGPKPGCNPPYRITADGVREYKPECL
ncbi:MAG: protein kinase, partial [Polyangiaceae bacterium]|nr:protein kinase [Polyangiaceae bacterium]